MTILQFHKNLKNVNLTRIYKATMKELEPEIIDLNHSQLEVGKDASGSKLPEYQDQIHYRRFKSSIGSKSGSNFDLKVSGDFFEGFFGKFNGDSFLINSSDLKRDELVQMTSPEIFGLTKENLNKFIDKDFYPLFMKKLRSQLQLN